jgi:hypothetical protein
VSVHRYPPQTLVGDYMRAGLGLLLTVAALLYLQPGILMGLAISAIAALCLFFVLRTVDRNRIVVSLEDDAITVTGFRKAAVRWDDMARMNLAYYATKRDKSDGWMEITLKDAATTIKLDSRLQNFGAVVVKAARVARERRIPLNQITLSNLRALKITGE